MKQSLRIPGPAELPAEVLSALGRQMVALRGDEDFIRALEEVLGFMQVCFNTRSDVLVFSASGTGGMESAVVNTLSRGQRALVCVNGEFGRRFADIATRFGVRVESVENEWGKPIDVGQVRERLDADNDKAIKAVLAIHNETSTGVLNPIEALGSVVAKHGALFIVDAVSSLGCTAYFADEWSVDVSVTASQKGLMCPPGLALIGVSEKAWRAAETSDLPKYYWDYKLARGLVDKTRGASIDQLPGIPRTPPISLIFALQRALQLMKSEGLCNIFERHRRLAIALRAGLRAMGLKVVVEEEWASPSTTLVELPEGLDSKSCMAALKVRYNVVVAGGPDRLPKGVVRIGHLGYVDIKDILVVLTALEDVLDERELIDARVLGKACVTARQAYFHQEPDR